MSIFVSFFTNLTWPENNNQIKLFILQRNRICKKVKWLAYHYFKIKEDGKHFKQKCYNYKRLCPAIQLTLFILLENICQKHILQKSKIASPFIKIKDVGKTVIKSQKLQVEKVWQYLLAPSH